MANGTYDDSVDDKLNYVKIKDGNIEQGDLIRRLFHPQQMV